MARPYLILLLPILLVALCTSCTTTAVSLTAQHPRDQRRVGRPDMTGRTAEWIAAEAEQLSNSINGDIVTTDVLNVLFTTDIETEMQVDELPERAREDLLEQRCAMRLISIGPDQPGLFVHVSTRSIVGNDAYFIYRIDGQHLVRVDQFGGATCELLNDRVHNGRYDIYTCWHDSAYGVPCTCWRWNGAAYTAYRTGILDTRKQ